MNKRSTILIISYYYLPYNTPAVYRLGSFASALIADGYEVVVLTSISRRSAIDERIGERFSSDVEVVRTGCWEPIRGNVNASFLVRIWNKLAEIVETHILPIDSSFLWMLPAVVRARQIIRERDIHTVLISSPPHSSQLAGLFLPRKPGMTLISDHRDGWIHNFIHRNRNVISTAFNRFAEKLVMNRADRVIANTHGNRALLERDYPCVRGKVDVILNGYLRLDSVPVGDKNIYNFYRDDKFHLVYTGECYSGYIYKILYVLEKLKERHPDLGDCFRLDMCGLIEDADLQSFADRGLDDVFKYHGFVSYEESIEMIRSGDMALLLMLDTSYHVVVSKLYFYLGSRRPIFGLIPEGDAADIIREVNAGYVVTSDKLDEAVEVLSRLIFEPDEPMIQYKDEAWLHYSREYQAEKLVKLVAESKVNL